MNDEEQCNKEIQEILEKYSCTLKVYALLDTEETKFKVEIIKK